MQRELQIAWENARSIESSEIHRSQMQKIGAVQKEDRQYIFFKDTQGRYWYETQIKGPSGYQTEYEHIFGKRERRRWI